MSICKERNSVFAEWQVFGFLFGLASFKSGTVILSEEMILQGGRSQGSQLNTMAATDSPSQVERLLRWLADVVRSVVCRERGLCAGIRFF